jgi:hypothetical protein
MFINYDGGDEPPHQPRGRTMTAADIVRRMGIQAPAAAPSPPIPLVAPPSIPLPPLGPFAKQVVATIRRDFVKWGHRQFNAIAHIPAAIEDILNGERHGQVILSACDAGLGKTTAINRSVQEMLANPDYKDASALVCIPRITEIEAFVRDLGEEHLQHVAVLVNACERKLRKLGKGRENANEARLLISTQAAVRKLLKGHRMFADVDELKFNGGTRTLLLWDEWLQPSLEYTIQTSRLNHLGGLLAEINEFSQLGETILDLATKARLAEDGEQVEAPDFEAMFPDADLGILKSVAGRASGDLEGLVENLWEVSTSSCGPTRRKAGTSRSSPSKSTCRPTSPFS